MSLDTNLTFCSMSDPGTTYRTREEVHRMRNTRDPIRGLQHYIEEWGLATEQELKRFDKEAKAEDPLRSTSGHPATLPERPRGGEILFFSRNYASLTRCAGPYLYPLFIRFLSFFSFRWTLYNEIHTYLHCSLRNASHKHQCRNLREKETLRLWEPSYK